MKFCIWPGTWTDFL